MAEQQTLEHRILVALTAQRIEEAIRDFGRSHGDILKSMGVNVRDVQVLGLDIAGEAYGILKTKAQQLSEKKS